MNSGSKQWKRILQLLAFMPSNYWKKKKILAIFVTTLAKIESDGDWSIIINEASLNSGCPTGTWPSDLYQEVVSGYRCRVNFSYFNNNRLKFPSLEGYGLFFMPIFCKLPEIWNPCHRLIHIQEGNSIGNLIMWSFACDASISFDSMWKLHHNYQLAIVMFEYHTKLVLWGKSIA